MPDFIAYALIIFIGWAYLPYMLFRFGAEIFIDLGRRRDATQLEEIVSALLPSMLINIIPFIIFWLTPFSVPRIVLASMFARDHDDLIDFIYAGSWAGFVFYLAVLWFFAVLYGVWFGRSARKVCKDEKTYNGVDDAHQKLDSKPLGWTIWWPFLRESMVPLYTWREQHPWVRVETKNGEVCYGRFVSYEKTTEGQLQGIRLEEVSRVFAEWAESNCGNDEAWKVAAYYINWDQIADVSVTNKVMAERYAEKIKERVRAAPSPAPTPILLVRGNTPDVLVRFEK